MASAVEKRSVYDLEQIDDQEALVYEAADMTRGNLPRENEESSERARRKPGRLAEGKKYVVPTGEMAAAKMKSRNMRIFEIWRVKNAYAKHAAICPWQI